MQVEGLLVAVLTIGLVTPVAAQARSRATELRIGAGLEWAGTTVSDETSTDLGPALIGQVGATLSSRSDLTLDVVVQPFKAHNPVADEAFKAVYSLLGVQVGLGPSHRGYIRPDVGLVFRSWSGSQVFKSHETSVAAGVGFGYEFPVGRSIGLAADVLLCFSGAEELSTRIVDLGLAVVPMGARTRSH